MVVSVGGESPQSITALILACHANIRRYVQLTARLSAGVGASTVEVGALAADIHRYFSEALPLHAQDENETIFPRLRGLDVRLDAALARMKAEHREIGPGDVARLVELTGKIAKEASALAGHAAELATLAARLETTFEAHLGYEEREVIPAMAKYLSAATRAIMADELRARR